ncbi:hypothetical protein Tco_1399690, partial [Tanacetum coccineum]
MNDQDMFRVNDLDGDEVIVDDTTSKSEEQSAKVTEVEVSTVDPVTTAGEVVTTANVEVTTVSAPITTIDEMTLAQTLIEIKAAKPKAITIAATTVTATVTRPKAKGVVIQESNETTTTKPSISSKEKGKCIMVKDPLLMKKKDQIKFDKEVARELEAKLKAEMEEEDRAARLKEEEANIALIESWENTQAMMDADYELAASLQEEDIAELTIKEKSKLFVKLMNKRKKNFEKLRAEERIRRLPTKAQKRNQMCTYLKNMAGFIHNQLKSKTFEEVQQAFNNTIEWINMGMVGREDRTFTIDDPLTSTATGVTRKMVWSRWENILASKNNGGLGVASFYSTNCALLFKWIWRFFNDGSSLWSRFIKAIHGVRGAMDTQSVPTRGSIWLDLVREFSFRKFKGIDLLALVKRKLGNGGNTLFWDDIWSGEAPLKSKFSRLYALEESK